MYNTKYTKRMMRRRRQLLLSFLMVLGVDPEIVVLELLSEEHSSSLAYWLTGPYRDNYGKRQPG